MSAPITARDDLTRVAMTAVGVGGFLWGFVPVFQQIYWSIACCVWPWQCYFDEWSTTRWGNGMLLAGILGIVILARADVKRKGALVLLGALAFALTHLAPSVSWWDPARWLEPTVSLLIAYAVNTTINPIQHRHALPPNDATTKQDRYVQPDGLPEIIPERIPTVTKAHSRRIPWFVALIHWLTKARTWKVSDDWMCTIGDQRCVIRANANFLFDGASIPRPLWWILSPIGILLIPGLLHDHGYRHRKLRALNPDTPGQDRDFWPHPTSNFKNKLYWDKLFIQSAVDINGFRALNTLAGYAVVLFGGLAWKGNRKREQAGQQEEDEDKQASILKFLLLPAIVIALLAVVLCIDSWIVALFVTIVKWTLIGYVLGMLTYFEGFVRLK